MSDNLAVEGATVKVALTPEQIQERIAASKAKRVGQIAPSSNGIIIPAGVRFIHLRRFVNSEDVLVQSFFGPELEAKGGATIAYHMNEGAVEGAISIVSNSDSYVRRVGRELSLERLIAHDPKWSIKLPKAFLIEMMGEETRQYIEQQILFENIDVETVTLAFKEAMSAIPFDRFRVKFMKESIFDAFNELYNFSKMKIYMA